MSDTAKNLLSSPNTARQSAPVPEVPPGMEAIDLGAGCFWCTEGVFQRIPGVHQVVSGYMGGHVENPTYEQVCGAKTGHVEITRVVFDPAQIGLDRLLDVFFTMHDPTTKDRQGNDAGPQYRSAVFYSTEAQRAAAEAAKERAAARWPAPIVTEIVPEAKFYPAENYHQDYYNLNKNRNPYCSYVITPKLRKLGLPE